MHQGRLDLQAQQGITLAGIVKKRLPLALGEIRGLKEDLLQPSKLIGLHEGPASDSCLASHIFATRQSS